MHSCPCPRPCAARSELPSRSSAQLGNDPHVLADGKTIIPDAVVARLALRSQVLGVGGERKALPAAFRLDRERVPAHVKLDHRSLDSLFFLGFLRASAG